MSSFPVLALPKFTHHFVLKCDASGEGIGEIMMQNRNMISYESRKLTYLERLYSIYEKEILSIMHSLKFFRKYLVGGKIVVKTNHNSLRYFL
jgi:hypothetical protein